VHRHKRRQGNLRNREVRWGDVLLRISSSYICSLACVLPACGQKKCTSLLGIPFDALPLTLARCSGRREHLSQHSGDISSPEDSPATYIHRRKGGAVQDIPVARGGQIDRPQVREAWEKAEQKIRDPQPLSNLMQVPLYPFSTLFFSPFPALVCILSLLSCFASLAFATYSCLTRCAHNFVPKLLARTQSHTRGKIKYM
jgi:hypothetical protein